MPQIIIFFKGIFVAAEAIAWGLVKGAEAGSQIVHQVRFLCTWIMGIKH
jgi:hypothetical protein